jgi:hypothetical protein
MFSELSSVSTGPGRSRDSHFARPITLSDSGRVVLCAHLRNEESMFEGT